MAMTDAEKKVLLKLMKDVKDIKKNVDYITEAVELLVKIQAEQVKNGRR